MRFTLEIELGSEVMQTQHHVREAIRRTFSAEAEERPITLHAGDSQPIYDANGATVGKWEVTETPQGLRITGAALAERAAEQRTRIGNTPQPEWGGYAETIITNPADFDALEVHGVRDLNQYADGEGTQCEVDDDNPEFFSVYAHLVQGGVECVGDFETWDEAVTYGKQLGKEHGWVITLHTSSVYSMAVQPGPRVEFVRAGQRGAHIDLWCVIDGDKVYPFGDDAYGKELAEREAAKWDNPGRFTYLGQY